MLLGPCSVVQWYGHFVKVELHVICETKATFIKGISIEIPSISLFNDLKFQKLKINILMTFDYEIKLHNIVVTFHKELKPSALLEVLKRNGGIEA